MKKLILLLFIPVLFACKKDSPTPPVNPEPEKTQFIELIINTGKNPNLYINEPIDGKKLYTKSDINPISGNIRIEKNYKIGQKVTITISNNDIEGIQLFIRNKGGGVLFSKSDDKEISYSFTAE